MPKYSKKKSFACDKCIYVHLRVKMWSLWLYRFPCAPALLYGFERRLDDKWISPTTSCNYRHYCVYVSTGIVGFSSDLCHRPLSIWYPTSCCVYDTAKAFITVSAIITVGRLAGGRAWQAGPFRWEHICMVIDVILLSPSLPSVCYPPAQPLIATDPPSRLWTHTALQCAFMLVDFRRFWCHNEGGWHFDMAPREFHALCVSNRLRLSAGRYSRNWSFIAFAWGRGEGGSSGVWGGGLPSHP